MGKSYPHITPELQTWLTSQKVFFVATSPLARDGHVNCSPKGGDTFRVLGEAEVAYLDFTGISDSCGHGVPLMDFVGHRDLIARWSDSKGPEGLAQYRALKNCASIDGLPGIPNPPVTTTGATG